jgi:Putative transposase
MGRQRNSRNAVAAWKRTNSPNQLVPVHRRHGNVTHEHIRRVLRNHAQCLHCRLDCGDLSPALGQGHAQQLPSVGLVIYHERADAVTSRHGDRPSSVATSRSLPQRRDGQGHGKGRPLALAWACSRDVPPMHLHEFSHNRQAEPQTSMGWRHRAIGLAKSFEDDRQHFGANADADVSDANHDLRPHALDPNVHPAMPRRELHGVRQEIPEHLLQPLWIPADWTRCRVTPCLNLEVLLRRGRANRVECRGDALHRIDRLHVQSQPAAVAASLQGREALGPRAGQPVRRLRSAAAVTVTGRRSARLEGFSLHADVAVPARRRDQLERVCRYILRPPLALERLTESTGGQLLYQFRRPWSDGSTALLLDPLSRWVGR